MGISSVHTGIYFVCQGMGYVLASMFFAGRVTRYGKYVSLCGSVIMIVALVFHLIIFNSPDSPQWQIAIILFVYGVGCGTILPSLMTISLKSIPENMLGASSGIYLTLQQISVAIGVAVVGGVFFQRLDNPPVSTLFPVAYRWATLLNISFLIIVSALLVLMPKRSKQPVR